MMDRLPADLFLSVERTGGCMGSFLRYLPGADCAQHPSPIYNIAPSRNRARQLVSLPK